MPIFLYLYSVGDLALCLVVFAVCAFTDFFDGYLARKLKVTTRFGAYYDAATDFVLVTGIFSFFFLKGLYSVWLLVLIAASFVQFLVSSVLFKKLFDPVGKYTGSALYIGVVLTVLLPSNATFTFVQYAFLGFFAVSLAARVLSIRRQV